MLHGKSSIVTGSTSGIGLGIATAFAAQGADVLLNGFGDADEIEAICRDLEREHGVRVRYSAADMSKPDDIRAMARYASAEFGKVDIVVNNAGMLRPSRNSLTRSGTQSSRSISRPHST